MCLRQGYGCDMLRSHARTGRATFAQWWRGVALGLMLPAQSLAATPATPFSSQELQQIATLGPWPPAPQRDPSNRVSGQPLAIELGRRLFRDPRMSPLGYIACVTCHQPDRAFTDHKARAHGLADLPRNTPALANLGQHHWFGWGGASDSLWMASIRAIVDAREFDGSTQSVVKLFVRDPELAACYRQVFRSSPLARPQHTLVNVGKALAAFVETLVTTSTPFDDQRDALLAGMAATTPYPVAAQRGLKLFVGAAGCVSCHRGPNFSDGEFHAGPATADAGRLDDVAQLKASPLNQLGPHNDDPKRRRAAATRELSEVLRGQYRTPSLRNVATSGPWLHDGSADGLLDAVRHQSPPGAALSPRQAQDLVAFVATLTDQLGERRPWTSAALLPCP